MSLLKRHVTGTAKVVVVIRFVDDLRCLISMDLFCRDMIYFARLGASTVVQYKAYKDTTIETQQDSAKCWTGRAQGTAQATMSRKGLKNERST